MRGENILTAQNMEFFNALLSLKSGVAASVCHLSL